MNNQYLINIANSKDAIACIIVANGKGDALKRTIKNLVKTKKDGYYVHFPVSFADINWDSMSAASIKKYLVNYGYRINVRRIPNDLGLGGMVVAKKFNKRYY